MLPNHIVVIILQCVHVSNYYIVCLKLSYICVIVVV